ncbi:MAG: UDP-N-acetylmuramoyl-L-alanine--D-glutamate ligase [Caulobacterales bacterium]
MIPIPDFDGRDIAVFGLARSGIAAARALQAGGARVHAWDDKPESRKAAAAAGVTLSDINARDWRDFAALVLAPGIPLTHPKPHRVVELARAVGVPILGDIELFARAIAARPAHQRPRVIAITGTNGKSTTTALIGHILGHCGLDVHVGGNIGTGVLALPALHAGAVYVLELSSYQLDLTHNLRPDAAVLLNITPDHLDRHGTMENYIGAKKRIFANQGAGDWAVVGVDTPETAAICTRLMTGASFVAPVSTIQALGRGVSVLSGKLYDALEGRAQAICDLADADTLPGRHNHQNAAAAYAAARAMGASPADIAAGLRSFPGLAHRMETVAIIDGVRFVNDSKATNADAAAQALAAYPRGVHWIAGGVAKDGGIASLARFFPKLAGAYVIGQSGDAFAETIGEAAGVCRAGQLDKAVTSAFEDARAKGGGIVLLSPAAASFDQYADFEARGDAFRAIVQALGAAPANKERA